MCRFAVQTLKYARPICLLAHSIFAIRLAFRERFRLRLLQINALHLVYVWPVCRDEMIGCCMRNATPPKRVAFYFKPIVSYLMRWYFRVYFQFSLSQSYVTRSIVDTERGPKAAKCIVFLLCLRLIILFSLRHVKLRKNRSTAAAKLI